jgi:hypothetical protein
MEADVAGYIAKMEAAGRATKSAFDGAGRGTGNLKRDLGDAEKATTRVGQAAERAGRDMDGFASRSSNAGKEIDRMSGRFRLLGEALFTLGPALIPISAGLIPALTGAGAAAGAAAGGVGVMVLAFAGVGKATKALNDYQIEPTKEHLQALNEEMSSLGKSGRQFVRFLDSIGGNLRQLQLIARANMFPGVEEGITSLLKLMPDAKTLVASLSAEVGNLAAEAGSALSGGGWVRFIHYLETDAAPTLDALGHTIGNLALGFANLFVDFAPATRDFTAGIEHASQAFAHWTANLNQTAGFQNFLTYVRTEGPQVVSLLEALGSMLLGVAKAAAPIGNAVLPVLTDLARIIAAIGNTPLGPYLYTTVAGMIALSRATKIADSVMGKFSTSSDRAGVSAGRAAGKFALIGGTAAAILAVGNAVGRLTDSMDRINPANLDRALQSLTLGGGPTKDIEKIVGDIGDVTSKWNSIDLGKPIDALFGATSTLDKKKQNIEALDQALANMVESGNAQKADQIMTQIFELTGRQGTSMDRVRSQFDAYNLAVKNAAEANHGYSASVEAAAEADRRTKAAIDGLVTAMQNQRAAALAAFDAETQYRQALKDAKHQADSNNAGIKGNSKAVLANRQALSQLAAAWNNQSDAVKNNTGRFRAARGAFIATATAMGVPTAAAKRLADRILQIPKSRVAHVAVDAGGSLTVIDAVQARLNRLQDRTIHITTVANKIAAGSAGTHLGGKADGGTVPGPRTPYGDKMLTMLAPGEEVISNRYGQADRYRADRAAGRIPGYASGGTVGRGQLAGIGSWASPSELAVRFSNLTVKQLQTLGREMDKLSNRNLKRLGVALDKASSLQEKQTQDAKDAFDAVTQKRTDLTSTISQGLTRDIFGGGGSAFNGQFAAGSVASVNQQLAMQDQDAKDFQRLERILRQRGVTGDALQQILAGGIDRVRTFAAASTGELQTYAQRYNAAYGAHGSVTTAASFGAALLTPEFNALQAAYAEQTAELKAIKAELAKDHKEQQQSRARATRAVRNQPQRARRG